MIRLLFFDDSIVPEKGVVASFHRSPFVPQKESSYIIIFIGDSHT